MRVFTAARWGSSLGCADCSAAYRVEILPLAALGLVEADAPTFDITVFVERDVAGHALKRNAGQDRQVLGWIGGIGLLLPFQQDIGGYLRRGSIELNLDVELALV